MAITVNENGVLKTLNVVNCNEGGVVYNCDVVNSNEGGTIYELYRNQTELLGKFYYGIGNYKGQYGYSLMSDGSITIDSYPYTPAQFTLPTVGPDTKFPIPAAGVEYRKEVDLSNVSIIHLDLSIKNSYYGSSLVFGVIELEEYNQHCEYDSFPYLHCKVMKHQSSGNTAVWDLDVSALTGLYMVGFSLGCGNSAKNYCYDVTINEWYLR